MRKPPATFFDLLEERMELRARDNAFGLEPLDDHIIRMCLDLDPPAVAAEAWRELPDPDIEAYEASLPPEPAAEPDWRSSG